MDKIKYWLLSMLCAIAAVFGLVACGEDGKGSSPVIGYNGNWWVDGVDTGIKAEGKDGVDGEDGEDGQTPYIGTNGNWWIGETDTGVKAEGKDALTACEHTYGEWQVDEKPTCTSIGGNYRTCSKCGNIEYDMIAAKGHTYQSQMLQEATCTQVGWKECICTTCGDYRYERISMIEHDYASVITSPTCTEGGYTTYTCACGDLYIDDETSAKGHNYASVITQPTCTEEGYTTYTCVCGDTYRDEIPATGHKGGTATTTTLAICEVCNQPYGTLLNGEGFTIYNVSSTALSNKTIGYGAQIDTENFMPTNNLTAEEEEMIAQRIKDMNLQYTRIKFFPEYFERANDNDDPNSFDAEAAGVAFNSTEMQALYKILDICEENNVKVDLSWYGCNTWYQSYDGEYTDGTWLGYPTSSNWVTAPRMEDDFNGYAEYAENIAVMLNYLINEKGYTCIYGFSVIEEMFYNATDTRDYDEFLECCEVIDARLKADGLRDKVQWIGQTTQNTALNGPARHFGEELESNKHIFDVAGMPNYRWENDTDMSSALTYFADVMEYCNEADKELIITEFCQGKHFLDAVNKTDIDDYTAGMYLARFMIAAADNGVGGLNHYILGDTMFGSYIHTMGLWYYRDNSIFTGIDNGTFLYDQAEGLVPWAAHPEYYFWGLICKYTDSGSEIYRIREQNKTNMDANTMMISFRLPDGSWSYMIANNTNETKKIAIVNDSADKPQSLQKYVLTEAGMPADRAVVLPESSGTIDTSSGVAYVEVPPMSFVVLSNKA